jgi:hypothetical protein
MTSKNSYIIKLYYIMRLGHWDHGPRSRTARARFILNNIIDLTIYIYRISNQTKSRSETGPSTTTSRGCYTASRRRSPTSGRRTAASERNQHLPALRGVPWPTRIVCQPDGPPPTPAMRAGRKPIPDCGLSYVRTGEIGPVVLGSGAAGKTLASRRTRMFAATRRASAMISERSNSCSHATHLRRDRHRANQQTGLPHLVPPTLHSSAAAPRSRGRAERLVRRSMTSSR